MLLVRYTEKSVAVIGPDTKQNKDTLMEMHGCYNPNLSVGPGYIFSATRTPTLQTYVSSHRHAPASAMGMTARLSSLAPENTVLAGSTEEQRPCVNVVSPSMVGKQLLDKASTIVYTVVKEDAEVLTVQYSTDNATLEGEARVVSGKWMIVRPAFTGQELSAL